MSSAKTERLLNLVICLLSTRRPLTKAQIRQAVPQYAENASTEAFDRMFERDKDELRELGIPLETTSEGALFDDEVGYSVDRDTYALPDVHLAPDELAVLGLASRVWQQASLAGPAARALTKLSALGVPPDERSLIGLEPRVRTAEPAFDALWSAVRDRVPVQFTYRTQSSGELASRTVEPWAVTSWHGRWYLTGFDRDRQAPRVFRLTRVASGVRRIGEAGEYAVPKDHDPRLMVGDQSVERLGRTAKLLVRRGGGQTLRRRAISVSASPEAEGRDELVVEFDDIDVLATELVTYGASALVVEPDDLRETVVRRLRGVLTAAQTAREGAA
jgi:proteasome accessory factor B